VSRSSPFAIVLTRGERAELTRRARKQTLRYREVVRARVVLLAAAGLPNHEIASRLDTTRESVGKWRKRFFEERVAGLKERQRPGRPPVFSP
jgi:transposase